MVRLASGVILCLTITANCLAQDLPAPPDLTLPTEVPAVRVSGSISLSADYYTYSASPDSAQKGRRPAQLYRVMFTPTIDFGGDISLPINLNFLTPETNTLTPSVPSPSLSQILQNPANAFGLSSISPKIKWAKFDLGSHSPNYSELTAGDQPLFGAGFDLNPAKIIISASFGATQRAVEPDTVRNSSGTFRRDQYMARIGYGTPGKTSVTINAAFAKDDPSSIKSNIVRIAPAHALATDSTVIVPPDTVRLLAAEGVVTSLSTKVIISDGVDLSAEAALSSFTRDQSASPVDLKGNPFEFLMPMRASTRSDVGGSAALSFAFASWGVKLSGVYLGAGFVPIGYAFGQADRFEVSVAPYVNLLDNALSLRGSIGQRVNNLSSTAGETATHVIGSASVNATISDAFSVSAQYSNFGVRNNQIGDTLKIQNVSQSMSIDPTIALQTGGVMHTLTTSIALDKYDDFNVVTGLESSNDTRTALASYSASFDSIPLSLGLMASYNENRLFEGDLVVRSIGFNAGYALFDRALEPRVSLIIGSSTFASAKTDEQLFLKFGVRARAGDLFSVSVDIGTNSFTYGDPIALGESFNESLAQLTLTTQF